MIRAEAEGSIKFAISLHHEISIAFQYTWNMATIDVGQYRRHAHIGSLVVAVRCVALRYKSYYFIYIPSTNDNDNENRNAWQFNWSMVFPWILIDNMF